MQPIAIARHLSFCLGNALKYILRAPYKGADEDIRKAQQYLQWETETPGPALTHQAYERAAMQIDALVNHLALPRGAMAELQSYFLIALDSYLASGERAYLDDMQEAARRLLDLPELRP